MDSPQPPDTGAAAVIKLLCLDQIQMVTSIRNLESIKGEDIGWKRKYIKNDLLTLKTFIEEMHSIGDIANRWIIKAVPSDIIISTPQLISHVEYYIKLIGFKLVIERATKAFNDTMDELKRDNQSKDSKWILQQYREARAKLLHKAPQLLSTRIQAISETPIEILVARARAEAAKIELPLVAAADPKVCPACSLVGHEQQQCSLRKEATAHGLYETEELRQQFQIDLDEMLEQLIEMGCDDEYIESQTNETKQSIQARRDKQSSKTKSNSAPEKVEKDVNALAHTEGAEPNTSEREQTSLNSPESTTENGGEYYTVTSTGQQLDDVNPIPEEDLSDSPLCPGHQPVLVVQGSVPGGNSDDSDGSSPRGGSTHSETSQLPSHSDHEECEKEDEPENQRSPGSRHSSTSSSGTSSSDYDSSSQLGPLPCHVLSFAKRCGQHLESSIYARYRDNGVLIQIKIGNTSQIYKGASQRDETQQGVIQAAEVIKRFSLQNKATLIPTTANFFHNCEDFTKAFDQGDKEPFEEILRILLDGGFPYVYIQQTEYPPSRTESNDRIADRLYVEWSFKSPKFRKLNRHAELACRTDVDHDPFSFVRKCDFVVVCSDKFGTSVVHIFARHEDNEKVRLRTLRNDYILFTEESEELSIKTNIIQACQQISSYIQRSLTSAQIGEVLIVHGSKDIELDIQTQHKSYVFSETHKIISRISPQAKIWFMKTRKIQENDEADYSLKSDILWNWFQSANKFAYLNPVQDEMQRSTTAAQAETPDRSSKTKQDRQQVNSPLLSSSFQ
ncbi:hypothetical protein CAEBREN_14385 [Caenorhabditis brenneri]|uniref:Uncharacterized protein n=1 Tax=Caenorhabditis brenneri TaxID=135651 RepID=G0PLR1_CAEBE|nr:hypothetical protein CAEBREN_14385 [Caenorhabditis brenneri]